MLIGQEMRRRIAFVVHLDPVHYHSYFRALKPCCQMEFAVECLDFEMSPATYCSIDPILK